MAAAKKKEPEVKEEAKEEVKTVVEVPLIVPPKPTSKVRQSGITPGRIVHFTREESTQTGTRVTQHPAMILGEASAASNFQPHDSAVDLKVFTKHGDEVKNGIMYSDSPRHGYWSWIPKT